MARQKTLSGLKAQIRAEHVAYVEQIQAATGLPISRLAKEAGVSGTTLSRFLTPEWSGTLSPVSLSRLEAFSGIRAPGFTPSAMTQGVSRHPLGFGEDAMRYEIDEVASEAADTLRSLLADRPNAYICKMQSDVLVMAGVRPGDWLIMDMVEAVRPRDGDIVAAQIDLTTRPRIVYRLYVRPDIIGATVQPGAVRPLLVDQFNVSIAAVMVQLVRCRADA